jgi:Ca-activated chloride channel homolog
VEAAKSGYFASHSEWENTVWGQFSAPAHLAGQAFGFLFAKDNQGFQSSRLVGAAGELFVYGSLKLLWWAADSFFVRRSALITGLSLAMAGLTLAGIGEWAANRVATTPPDAGSSAALTASSYTRDRVVVTPGPMPELPETSDHMPANSPGYTFRHQVPEVRLQFTVADERGRLVNNLSSDEVRVFDNQSPVNHVNEFERDDDLPLQLGVVIDTSDSVKRVLPQEKTAAIDFLDRVLRPQTDTAFVVGFAGEIKTWQIPTSDPQQLTVAINRLKEPGWGTRVFDAVYSACSGSLAAPSDRGSLHRAVILLTDGDDTDSLHSLADVIAAAQRSEIQIYPLTIHSPRIADRGDRVLQRLADSTGGRLYVAATAADLGTAFTQIEQDLRTQYYVSFPPQQSTPGFHSLRVEVRSGGKLEVRARQGYYALQP